MKKAKVDFSKLKDRFVEFDYLVPGKPTKHVRGYVRIEPNYPEDDTALDVQVSPSWTEVYYRGAIRNIRETKEDWR